MLAWLLSDSGSKNHDLRGSGVTIKSHCDCGTVTPVVEGDQAIGEIDFVGGASRHGGKNGVGVMKNDMRIGEERTQGIKRSLLVQFQRTTQQPPNFCKHHWTNQRWRLWRTCIVDQSAGAFALLIMISEQVTGEYIGVDPHNVFVRVRSKRSLAP